MGNSEESTETIKSHCNACLQETTHKILRLPHTKSTDVKLTQGGASYVAYSWIQIFYVLECCGCGEVSFRLEQGLDDGEDMGIIRYPPAMTRRPPPWVRKLPETIRELLEEVYSAYATGCFRLAAMGTRTIIDVVANDKVEDKNFNTFKEKLAALDSGGFIGGIFHSYDDESIDAAIEVGHAAAHRAYHPRPEVLSDLFDIIEHLLESVYVHPQAVRRLEQSTPKRERKEKPRPGT